MTSGSDQGILYASNSGLARRVRSRLYSHDPGLAHRQESRIDDLVCTLAGAMGSPGAGSRLRQAWRLPAALVPIAALLAGPAQALDVKDSEYAALKSCEKQFCEVVLNRQQDNFSCRLQKTWVKSKIKESVERKKLSWTVGDARCHSTLSLTRLNIFTAATSPKWTVEFAPHVVHCDVERENGTATVDVTLAPRILFRKGVAEKAWINVQKIDAPSGWKAALWTVAKLEDTVGLFHRDILKEINRLMHEKCPAEYGTAAARPARTEQPRTDAGGTR